MVSDVGEYYGRKKRLSASSVTGTNTGQTNAAASKPAAPKPRGKTSAGKRLLGVALSGEKLLGALGLDISGAPRPVRFAADNLLSPVGLAATALAPVTGGTSLGLRGAAGVATRLATRGGAELAVAGAATGAAKLADEVLPEDTPALARTAALIAAGLVGGGAAAAPISRRSAARAAGRVAVEGQAARSGRNFLASPNSFADDVALVATVPSGGRLSSTLRAPQRFANKVINPSANSKGEVGKALTAWQRRQIQNNDLTTAALASAFPGGVRSFQLDADGFVTNVFSDQPVHWSTVIGAIDAPSRFKLSEVQALERQRYLNVIDDVRSLLAEHGIKRGDAYLDGNFYVPRMAKSQSGTIFERPSDPDHIRLWETAEEGVLKGKINYATPDEVLQLHVRAALDEVAEKDLGEYLDNIAVSRRDAALTTPEGRATWGEFRKSVEEVEKIKGQIKAYREAAKAAYGADSETLRAQIRAIREQNRLAIGAARAERTTLKAERQSLLSQIREYRRALKVAATAENPAPRRPTSVVRKEQLKRNKARFEAARTELLKGDERLTGATEFPPGDLRAAAKRYTDVKKQGKRVNPVLEAKRQQYQYELDKALNGLGSRSVLDSYEERLAEIKAALANTRVSSGTEELSAKLRGIREAARGKTPDDLIEKLKAAREARDTHRKAWTAQKQRTFNALPGSKFGLDDTPVAVQTWKNGFLPKDDDMVRLSEWFNTVTGSVQPPSVPSTIRNVEQVGNYMRLFAASFDMASPFVQGLPVLASNPKAWGTMVKNHYLSFMKPEVQGEFIRRNLDDIVDMVNNGKVPLGDVEMFKAIQEGGVAAFLHRTNGLGSTLRRFQRSYDTGLMTARVEMWKALKPRWHGTPDELGKYIRNLTGGLDTRALGIGPTQRAIESLTLFAPKLMRSTLALAADASRPWTPQGQEAAQSMLRLMGASAGIMVLGNIASGLYRGDSEEEIERAIGDAVNPLSGGKFLSIKAGDHYYGIGGQIRSLSQMLTRAITDPDSMMSPDALDNPFVRYAQGRLSPFASANLAGAELLTQEKFNLLPFETVDNLPDFLALTGKSTMPFVMQGAIDEDWDITKPSDIPQHLVAPLSEFLGSRTSKFSPKDSLNQSAYNLFGTEYDDLTGAEQKMVDGLNPRAVEARREFGDVREINYRNEKDAINKEASDSLAELGRMTLAGTMSKEDFRVARDRILLRRLTRQEQALRDYDIESSPADSDKRRVLDAYYNTFDPISQGGASIVPGEIDWDLWNSLQNKLQEEVASGVYGNAARAQAYLDERTRFEEPPESKWFADNEDIIRDAGYWSERDLAFEEIKGMAAQEGITAAHELDRALVAATQQGDTARIATLGALIRVLDRMTGRRRELLRLQNPDLDQALLANGVVSTPILARRR